MKTGIALVRHPLTQFSYESVPADLGMWLLCHETKSQIRRTSGGAAPERITAYEHYETNDLVDHDAARIIETSDCRGIIALSEVDMLRAAQLRTHYGIPGLKYPTALRFRDKAAMKEHLRAAGHQVPSHLVVDSGLDLKKAADTFGYPFVLKPRMGGGSIGAQIVRDASQLREVLAKGLRTNFYTPAHLEAEEFVEGDLYHVDGLVLDGAVCLLTVSRYRSDILEFSTVVSTRMVDQNTPRAREMKVFTTGVLAGLGLLERGTHSYFHCEAFATPGGPVLCEVAARPGGLGIVDQVDTYTGLSTFELLLAATFGDKVPEPFADTSGPLVGWVGVPKGCDPEVVRRGVPAAHLAGGRIHNTAASGQQISSVDLDGFVLMRSHDEQELDALLGAAVARVAQEARRAA
ncbi:acetyl-CoA carboxylase biotin carboxylase subunit family protein [Streptomyces sp. NPDC058195]|uniref:ATP-grasp domain-containing protein n=1 Tax=Streptomyces sp. NPDC058195 TaxID=3346375 RepID=UPI0036EA7128